MAHTKAMLIGAALCVLASPAGALSHRMVTGNELLAACRAQDLVPRDAGFCSGFLRGVIETSLGTVFCPPERVTVGQTMDVVTKALSDHPANRHEPASGYIQGYLKGTWPCEGVQAERWRGKEN
jgi:hypothetical protein